VRLLGRSLVGIFGGLLLLLDAASWAVEWALAWRPIRVALEMVNLEQAISYIGQWEYFTWLANPAVQFGIMAAGLALIFWDRKRPTWLPSPELSSRQMIIGGLIIVVIGAAMISYGVWRTPQESNALAATPIVPKVVAKPLRRYHEVDVEPLTRALTELSAILNDNATVLLSDTKSFEENFQGNLLKDGNPTALIATLEQLEIRAQNVSQRIYSIEKKNEFYRDEVRYADDASNGEIVGSVGINARNLAQALTGITGKPNSWTFALLGPWTNALEQSRGQAHDRIELAKNRIQELRKDIVAVVEK
jgi:hypothetical protein